MSALPSQPAATYNPLSRRRHQREILRQVTLPILLGSVILAAICVLAWVWGMGGGEVSRWASISLLWLIVPVMLAALVTLLFLIGSIYLTVRLIVAIPKYSYQALGWLLLVGVYLHKLNDRLVEPFLRMQMISASMKTLTRRKD